MIGILVVNVLVAFAAAAYLAPTIVGIRRRVVNVGSVAAINVLLGWTLIGWAVALAMAVRTNPPAYQGWAGGPPVRPLPPPPPPPPPAAARPPGRA